MHSRLPDYLLHTNKFIVDFVPVRNKRVVRSLAKLGWTCNWMKGLLNIDNWMSDIVIAQYSYNYVHDWFFDDEF